MGFDTYESVVKEANAAQACKMKHHCERRAYIMNQWGSNPQPQAEVWGSHGDGEDYTQEQLFTGTKEECQTYINTFQGLTAEEQEEYSLPKYPTLRVSENDRCLVCDLYEKRQAQVAEGRMPPFFIVAWGISQRYGGPEEGGWWYDVTTVEAVRKAYTFRQALKLYRELKQEYPQPRFRRTSAANRGEPDMFFHTFYGEDDPRWPQDSPPGRPRYE